MRMAAPKWQRFVSSSGGKLHEVGFRLGEQVWSPRYAPRFYNIGQEGRVFPSLVAETPNTATRIDGPLLPERSADSGLETSRMIQSVHSH
jgi:hypothetical protein